MHKKHPINISLQEALQFYDTPKSIRQALTTLDANSDNQDLCKINTKNIDQANAFAGPYGNYDIPHAGAAPVPVFRKACGCIMKLVPEAHASQCSSVNSDKTGSHK